MKKLISILLVAVMLFASVTVILPASAADNAALGAKITEAKAKVEGKGAEDFEPATWTSFSDALAEAESVFANAEATQEEIDSALEKLTYTAKALTLVGQVNKNFLIEEIGAASQFKSESDENKYTPKTWDAFASAITDATVLLSKADATQQEVDAAVEALKNTKSALVSRADFSALEAKIAEVEALVPSNYYAESWATIDPPLKAAKAALADKDASQDAIDTVIKTLTDAVALLRGKKNVMLSANLADQYFGAGNVFYFDYHKFITAKGYTAGQRFPTSLEESGNQADPDYVLRLATIDGSGTMKACDGNKTVGLIHNSASVKINEKDYGHAFGYSFLEAPTVDYVKFYLPIDTKIKSIDVFGAVRTKKAGVEGNVLYGKADGSNTDETALTTEKVFLGTFNVPKASAGAQNIELGGALEEAYKAEYIYFALTFTNDFEMGSFYEIYEIELMGLEKDAADFSALKKAYANYKKQIREEWTDTTWKILEDAAKVAASVNKNSLSTSAQISDATIALEAALKLKPGKKDSLEKAINKLDKLNQSEYTVDSWAALIKVVDAGKEGMKNPDLIQSEINKLATAINTAISALQKPGNKADLETALIVAKDKNKEYYQGNPDAWTAFEEAIRAAAIVFADANALQKDIDAAKENIFLTQSNLKITPGVTIPGDEPEPLQTESATETETETEPVEESETVIETETETETETESESVTEADTAKNNVVSYRGGCGSSVAVSALSVVCAIGVMIGVKKKED